MTELFFVAPAVWLVTYLLHSTLLYGIVWWIDRRGLARAPASREHLWRAALIGALLTATVQSAGLVQRVPFGALFVVRGAFAADPARAAPLPARLSVTADRPASPGRPMTASASDATAASAVAPAASPAVTPAAVPAGWRGVLDRLRAALARDWASGLTLLWLAGATLAALRIVALGRIARRELTDRAPADAALAAEFSGLCAAQRVRPPSLSVAPALAGPISLPNGEIVVPPWAVLSLDARQRRAMLAHELAHQVRRDPQWLLFTLALDVLLWMQPLNSLARRRLAGLAELQADAWAARAVDDPRALAECLAECAEHVHENRAALFGAAMTTDSPLVERVDRLMQEIHMHASKTSWALRITVTMALVAAVFLLPGCDVEGLSFGGQGASTHISISDDGDSSVTVRRPGYSLHMESDGRPAFTTDESDVARLEPGGEFDLTEKLDGVKHEYKVHADRAGTLTRTYARDGVDLPLDAVATQWLAEALPRMFRESGFDAEARVQRLLAKGGPAQVLAEADLASGDHPRAIYLGLLFGSAKLDSADMGRALAAAARLESDHELAELLTEVMRHLPADAGADVRAAWLAAAAEIDSDHDLGRTIEAGLARADGDAPFAAALVALAAERMDSDYALRAVLERVAPRAADPALATACLAAARTLDSDFDRRCALVVLLGEATLDTTQLQSVLEATAELGSDFEKRTLLEALAECVAADPALNRRYREVASGLSDFERGAALVALDDATRP